MVVNTVQPDVLHLPDEVTRMITNECDLPSLIALRKTCRALYHEANDLLLFDHRRILLPYVRKPETLWSLLADSRAVVGGFAALSFIMRDTTIQSPDLEIYAPASLAEQLVSNLQNTDTLALTVRNIRLHRHDYRSLPYHVSRATTFDAIRGYTITIYASTTDSPLQPIARSGTTALYNWVSPHAFACAYPTLTLLRRALGRSPERFEAHLHCAYTRLVKYDFLVETEPFVWPEYAVYSTPSDAPWHFPCLRSLHLCPDQSRYFGDVGSLQTVFNLKDFDETKLRRERQPPYGITVAWRLDCTHRSCAELCLLYDPILPNHVFTTPVFIGGPFSSLQIMY